MLTQLKPKKCSQCRKEFLPRNSMQTVCGPVCAGRKVRSDKKAVRVADRAKREAMKSIRELIAEAQTAFNAWIRWRDKDLPCFVCGRPFLPDVKGRAMHAGHVRSRGAAGHLRFNEDNCHGECEGCNGPNGAKPHEIEAGAIRRIGQARYDVLKNDNAPHKWTKEELRSIRDTYRAKVREARKA